MATMITVRLPDNLKRRLDAYCFMTGSSMTGAVADAVGAFLTADPAIVARIDAALATTDPTSDA